MPMAPFIFVYRFRKAEKSAPRKSQVLLWSSHLRRLLVPTTGCVARRDTAWSGSTSGRAAMAAAAAMPASGRSIGKATGRPRSGGRSQGEACRRGCCRCSQGERAELAAQVLQVAAAKQRAAANQQVADKQRAAAFCEVDSQQWFFESQQVNRPHETEADLPAKHARFAGECSRLICAMFDAWYTLV